MEIRFNKINRRKMKILLLEDEQHKIDNVTSFLRSLLPDCSIEQVSTLFDFNKILGSESFDLIILDLIVPRFKDSNETADTQQVIEAIRSEYRSINFKTPAIALTCYDIKAEENFRPLNELDITVITYSQDSDAWKKALHRKIECLPAKQKADFVIICALEKEAQGFQQTEAVVGRSEVIYGLNCTTIAVGAKKGIIVTCPRMGLVTASITTSQALMAFEPAIVCMSGICGGVSVASDIYDVVIADPCHQHDVGKWNDDKFAPEIYSVPIDFQLVQKFRQLISSDATLKKLAAGISLDRPEFPPNKNQFEFKIKIAPASSGSAVVADQKIVDQIKTHQRKCAIFEMESYAVYEAARLSPLQPYYFSAKTVVDNGTSDKSDEFHRVGCILSARLVVELLKSITITDDR